MGAATGDSGGRLPLSHRASALLFQECRIGRRRRTGALRARQPGTAPTAAALVSSRSRPTRGPAIAVSAYMPCR